MLNNFNFWNCMNSKMDALSLLKISFLTNGFLLVCEILTFLPFQ